MEYWLKNKDKSIQLPIRPASFDVTFENTHQTVNVQTRGDVTILGKKGLKAYTIESFFPAQDYPFADYAKDRNPWEYVKEILGWQETPIQFIITKTKINKNVIITSFQFGEDDGTGDITYSITMKDYRPPKYTKPLKAVLEPVKTEKKKPEKENSRSDNKPKKKIHTVNGNDTLRSIAKKYYGSGSYANKIYNANKTVIEKAAKKHGRVSSAHNGVNGWYIYDGTKLVIP